ncbi:hypothetical protein [Motiliproteus sp. SC1-56]|uniref:hypothetical protein n=1 Tax=Motiliproteus sp. SC1-56 TaxID=2799565 RepID=UPI001A8E6FE2|nr:hypothetical protein [Motiliproteus sp. SC1-56]
MTERQSKNARFIASAFSLLGALQFLSVWYLMLFYALPGKQSVWVEAYEQASYSLSIENPERWLFFSTLASISISFICCFLFWFAGLGRFAMSLVVLHSVAAFFIYDIDATLILAMPLIMLPAYFSRNLKSA